MADSIESQNIVGYQDITIPGNASGSSYSLFCVTFKNTAGGSFKINSIKICKADGTEVDDTSANRSRDKITLMKLNPTTAVVYDEEYSYTTKDGKLVSGLYHYKFKIEYPEKTKK